MPSRSASPKPVRTPRRTKKTVVVDTSEDRSNDRWQSKAAPNVLESTIGPLVLLLLCPTAVNAFAFCVKELDGSLAALLETARDDGAAAFIRRLFPTPTTDALTFLGGLLVLQTLLLIAVPGPRFNGPRAPSGHIPEYHDNALVAFCATLLALGGACWHGLLHATLIYDELQPILTTLNAGALLLSAGLCIKGLRSPSTADCGSSGSLIMDLYWGTELYPRVSLLGRSVDLKQLFIARFGIILWALFAISFAAKSSEVQGGGHGRGGALGVPNAQLVSSGLMVVYIFKFFLWERWYTHAADIQVDRFGFMMCWGPICFMPLVHTLQNLFLVAQPGLQLSTPQALGWFALGNLMTLLNYDSDTQRHRIRSSNGRCLVWGEPCEVIRARYTTADGKKHTSLLSCSGYQKLARHFHYLPDIINLCLYCSPAGFTHVLPHLYFLYLTSLLLHRTYRIDARCRAKYGRAWDEYVRRVPYRLLPGVW
jgi:7-dehydrocholesterol reductase